MDVPLKGANPPPGTDELILEPGAKRSTIDALFENDERESSFRRRSDRYGFGNAAG